MNCYYYYSSSLLLSQGNTTHNTIISLFILFLSIARTLRYNTVMTPNNKNELELTFCQKRPSTEVQLSFFTAQFGLIFTTTVNHSCWVVYKRTDSPEVTPTVSQRDRTSGSTQ